MSYDVTPPRPLSIFLVMNQENKVVAIDGTLDDILRGVADRARGYILDGSGEMVYMSPDMAGDIELAEASEEEPQDD